MKNLGRKIATIINKGETEEYAINIVNDRQDLELLLAAGKDSDGNVILKYRIIPEDKEEVLHTDKEANFIKELPDVSEQELLQFFN